ncbi:DUF4391 domain-containing protein [Exiguobacterium qingdaonense]|uniref:DUF4391 domain-containing protein n=1 Tax=Exiguobacterium qingdaonense TaxID=2751251 RepID=UPI001BECBB79|nr:DUF4391 domain-containing protein [Exiguobacterium qingdaonense]
MKEWLIHRLQIPQRAVLNRKIPKKAFFTQANLSKSEKEMFTSQIESIYLLSVMNEQSMNIPVYQVDEFNYSEVVWIYVELRDMKNINRIIGTIHKAIFNPVVLVLSSPEGHFLMSTSHKRLNKNDKTKVVVDQPTKTDWFNPQEDDTPYTKLMNSLFVSNLSFESLYSIYEDIQQWIKCEEVIRLVGKLPSCKDKRDQVINLLNIVQECSREIARLHQVLEDQINFGRKIEIHMKIKNMEKSKCVKLNEIITIIDVRDEK